MSANSQLHKRHVYILTHTLNLRTPFLINSLVAILREKGIYIRIVDIKKHSLSKA